MYINDLHNVHPHFITEYRTHIFTAALKVGSSKQPNQSQPYHPFISLSFAPTLLPTPPHHHFCFIHHPSTLSLTPSSPHTHCRKPKTQNPNSTNPQCPQTHLLSSPSFASSSLSYPPHWHYPIRTRLQCSHSFLNLFPQLQSLHSQSNPT